MTHYLGTHSLSSERGKLYRSGVTFFERPDRFLSFVASCSAWRACEVIPEPYNQDAHDLFIVEVVAAWSDTRAFKDGHWQFETSGQDWQAFTALPTVISTQSAKRSMWSGHVRNEA